MRWPSDPVARALVESVLADPDLAPSETTWRIEVGDNIVEGDAERSRFDSLEWGFEDEGPAATLTATVAGLIPVTSIPLGTPVKLDVAIAGIATRVFTGMLLAPRFPGTAETQLRAATGGYWLDKIRLMERLAMSNWAPVDVAANALARLPYTGTLDIPNITTPKFNRGDDADQIESFNELNTPSDILEALTDEVPLEITDTALDGVRVRRPVPLRQVGEPVATFVLGRDMDEDGGLSYEAAIEAEYSAVMAYRMVDEADGQGQKVQLIPGLERVEIPGSRAPYAAVYPIEVSDTTVDYLSNAREAVYDAVNALSGRVWRATANLLFNHPYLERGDVVALLEDGEDDAGPYRRKLTTRIASLRGFLPLRATTLTGEALMSEERAPRGWTFRPLVRRDRSGTGGVLEHTMQVGALYPATSLYPSTTLYPAE